MKTDIKSLLPEEISERLAGLGEPEYRAEQIFRWLSRGASSFDEMTDLPKGLRAGLEEHFHIPTLKLLEKQVSEKDGTTKYLWELEDKNAIEAVMMQYQHGNTLCVSTQVGCRMGCAFCASTLGGLVRNLAPSEMLDQVLRSEKDFGSPVSNVVLMGIGEPLDNFDHVIRFLHLASHPQGRNIGMRHFSLSTCGLADKFDKLAAYNLKLTLSVSLHAPDDETRTLLMPVNKSTGVDRLLKACEEYFAVTGRRVTFEYAMIDGVNDTRHHARLLSEKLGGLSGPHVNLIPWNHVEGKPYAPSDREKVSDFKRLLEERGINVTVRRRMGSDLNASCGQLRGKAVGARSRNNGRTR